MFLLFKSHCGEVVMLHTKSPVWVPSPKFEGSEFQWNNSKTRPRLVKSDGSKRAVNTELI